MRSCRRITLTNGHSKNGHSLWLIEPEPEPEPTRQPPSPVIPSVNNNYHGERQRLLVFHFAVLYNNSASGCSFG